MRFAKAGVALGGALMLATVGLQTSLSTQGSVQRKGWICRLVVLNGPGAVAALTHWSCCIEGRRSMNIRSLFLCFILLSVVGTSPTSSEGQHIAGSIQNISMIQLIANPEKFDGKTVSVVGFLGIEPENERLYLTEEDHQRIFAHNGLWVDLPSLTGKEQEELDRHYVQIVGTFKQGGRFPYAAGGGLTDIKRCWRWPDIRSEMKAEAARRKKP